MIKSVENEKSSAPIFWPLNTTVTARNNLNNSPWTAPFSFHAVLSLLPSRFTFVKSPSGIDMNASSPSANSSILQIIVSEIILLSIILIIFASVKSVILLIISSDNVSLLKSSPTSVCIDTNIFLISPFSLATTFTFSLVGFTSSKVAKSKLSASVDATFSPST